jgi:translation elongation factor EF-G
MYSHKFKSKPKKQLVQEIEEIAAGDVCAMFGVDCSSMDSFTDGTCVMF